MATGMTPTDAVATDAARLARRIEAFRTRRPGPASSGPGRPVPGRPRSAELAERLAAGLEGEVVRSAAGAYVRVDRPARPLPVDRAALATLPGHPPARTPLLCLDTETTGLGTATGTIVFLVGLGRWEADRFRQVQLLLPDHPDEPALLEALAREIPPDAWLVTYNGRGFDWPLLVTRYRMARSGAPRHAGHLDLLPLVRQVFRHRLMNARLRTVEQELLGVRRHGDVDGWEIPGRYLSFLRDRDPSGLVDVVRHNDEDVRTLARLLAHLGERYGDPERRASAPTGDLAGLARAYLSHGRPEEALACIDGALAIVDGAKPAAHTQAWGPGRLAAERARLLRRLGRVDEALEAWRAIAGGRGPFVGLAWIEAAKLLEHRRRDIESAIAAMEAAGRLAERARLLGRPIAWLEADLGPRRRRLRRRLAGGTRPAP